MENADITIIGAGVIGLAIAAQIARPERRIFVLEKNARHGEGISSRNSEVIHAGIYYPEGSLKASLCVEGSRRLYEIAARQSLPHRKTGKLIVATQTEEIGELERLIKAGRANGAPRLKMLTRAQVAKMEPDINALAALYSPETGILSAHALMNYFLMRALEGNAALVCRTAVTGISREGQGWRISTHNDRSEAFDFLSARVINCAGLFSDTIANMPANAGYRLHYCKGDYFSLTGVKAGSVKRLIYPAPLKNTVGLGVHLTLDLNGRLRLGPDATYIDREEDYRVAPEKAAGFYAAASRYLPFLKKDQLCPDMAGIRPKLQGPHDPVCDFVIREDAPGFINLVGIESPGLTASPAIARHVAAML